MRAAHLMVRCAPRIGELMRAGGSYRFSWFSSSRAGSRRAPRGKKVSVRVLLTSAGNGPSNNVMRSLRAGWKSAFVVGCNEDQFVLKNSSADRNYVVPPAGHPRWAAALRRIVATERIELILPIVDTDVTALSAVRRQLGRQLFLPRESTLATCRDKLRLIAQLRRHGVPAPASYAVKRLDDVGSIFRKLGTARPLWCRVRTGAGALGALPVRTPAQARSWIRYWGEMRGIPAREFMLSEYLPGRDFGCQSLWRDGELILIKTYERLSYLGTGSQPAQVSSVAGLAKTAIAPDVVDVCAKAVRLLDKRANGVYSIDLKEDARGVPCITEINAGRFSSATNIFDLAGQHNMVATFVRLARGEHVQFDDAHDAVDDWYMLRDIDMPPHIFHASNFFDRVESAWESSGSLPGRSARGRSGHGKFQADAESRRRTVVRHGRGNAEEPGNPRDDARLQEGGRPA
jgi:biotin carboxylase